MTAQVTVNGSPTRLSDLERRAWVGFLRAHAVLIRRMDERLRAEHDLPLSSYEVLALLALAPNRRLRMSELAASVNLTQSGGTRLVSRLEQQGLVERRRDPADGRGANAVLTRSGLARLRRANALHLGQVRAQFLEKFTADELATLVSWWDRIDSDD